MSEKSPTHNNPPDERPDPYRARPADDGGMYLLMPRDEHLLPPLPDKPERVVIAWPDEGKKSEPSAS
ncbi:hypothetical protein [Kerstersia gyiorum]|uniref:hypothetical protein n=1 Tax=Kerstersia gyiorum TaxID=206506 RepID=UPI0020A0D117|nr:hypothetical protein [Kerstersia gyiorum]MCP1680659.1 hypothetical protein [Kerstersia gyiorum]MCP1825195.1 hypothetical protein [Kerstersia gyiorum]MCP1828604.1 hypothetical protein [Kerstersia gyiorum]MCW2452238.1 hypothetical protein [Kerstersia gyiorum]